MWYAEVRSRAFGVGWKRAWRALTCSVYARVAMERRARRGGAATGRAVERDETRRDGSALARSTGRSARFFRRPTLSVAPLPVSCESTRLQSTPLSCPPLPPPASPPNRRSTRPTSNLFNSSWARPSASRRPRSPRQPRPAAKTLPKPAICTSCFETQAPSRARRRERDAVAPRRGRR